MKEEKTYKEKLAELYAMIDRLPRKPRRPIHDFLMGKASDVKEVYRYILEAIDNLVAFRNIILWDRDFDDYFLFKILEVKLRKLLIYFRDESRPFVSTNNYILVNDIKMALKYVRVYLYYEVGEDEDIEKEIKIKEKAKQKAMQIISEKSSDWWD